MKKVLFFLMIALTCFTWGVKAQVNTLLSENFDGMSSIATSYSATDWYAYNDGDGNNWTLNSSSDYANSGNNSAMYSYDYYDDADCYLVSAPFTVSAQMDELSVSLYECVRSSSYAESFEVFLVLANDITNDGDVVSAMHYAAIASATYTNVTYAEVTGINDNATLAGQSVRLVVHCTSEANNWNLYIDDITVTETLIEDCPKPKDLLVTNLTAESATLGWTAPATAPSNGYNVRYRIAEVQNPYFFDDFEDGLTQWTIYTDGEAPQNNGWYTINPQNSLSFVAYSGTYCASSWSWNSSAYDANNWLVTPQVPLAGTLKFYVRTNPGYPDEYEVLLSTTGNAEADFTVTLQAMATAPATGEWEEVSIDLSTYSGNGYIAIHHVDNDNNYLLIDDFGIYGDPTPAGEWVPTTSNTNSKDISGLTENTTYEFEVQSNCGGGETSSWVASTFTTLPSCMPVADLEVSATTTTTVSLTWTDQNGGSASYIITDGDDNSVTVTDLTTTGCTVIELTANTAYTFKVSADCGSTVESIQARTECDALTELPYEEDFEASSVNIYCWDVDGFNRLNSNTYAHNGSVSLYSEAALAYAILPATETNISDLMINFWWYNYYGGYDFGTLEVGYITNEADYGSFVTVGTIDMSVSSDVYAQTIDYVFTGAPADARIALKYTEGADYALVVIDDVTIDFAPSCMKPSSLSVTGGANAVITWVGEAASFDIALSQDPSVAPGDVIIGNTVENEFDLSSFTNVGENYVYVRANCGTNGYSDWANTSFDVNYCTPNPTSHDGSGITGVSFGTGDYVVANGDGSASLPASSPYYGDYTSMIGAVQAGIESTIAITTGTNSYPYTFVIWVDLDNSYSFEDSEILYIGKASSGNGTLNATITIPATQATGDYRMRIYGADSYFSSFYGSGTTNWEAAHDPCSSGTYRHAHDYTLRVLEAPSCMPAADVAVAPENITTTTAVISWTNNNGTEGKYTVKQGETVLTTTATTSYELTSLTAATTYPAGTFTVTSNCDETMVVNVPAFTTACDAITTFPWSENFESYASGNFSANCWVNEHIAGTATTNVFKISTSSNGSNSTHQLQLPDQASGNMIKLRLPGMTLPGDNYQFVLDIYRSNSTYSPSDNPYEGIRVYASLNGEIEGATELAFIPRQFNETNGSIPAESEAGWYTYELPIGMSGTCYIILRGESRYCTSTYMDNFVVEAISTCKKPTALMLETPTSRTAHTATLKWTNGSEGQNAWQIAYSTDANFDPATVIPVDVTTNPATIEGLEQSTTYYAYVRANCGTDGYSAWCINKATFTTLAGNAVPTDLAVTNITSSSATANWTGVATNVNHVSYDLYYSTENTAPEAGTLPTVSGINATTYDLTELSDATIYYIWVRDNCGTDGYSAWSPVVYFTTLANCPVPVLAANAFSDISGHAATVTWTGFTENDYYNVYYRVKQGIDEDFNGTSIPGGWTRSSGLVDEVVAGTTTLSNSTNWNFVNSTTGVFSSKHMKLNIYGNSRKDWLVTPVIALPENSSLSFDLALTAWNSTDANSSTCDDDRFVVLIYANDAWTILREWNNSGSANVYNNIASAGENVNIDLSSYSGNVKIAFYGESTTTGNGDNDMHIDHVVVSGTPSDWEQVNPNPTTTITTITNLTPETPYEVYVTGHCTTGNVTTDPSDTMTFTTDVACPTPTNLTFVSTTTTTATVNWTSPGITSWYVWYKANGDASYSSVHVEETDPTTDPITATIPDLTPGTTYTVYVTADCSADNDGNSEKSDSITFTTVCVERSAVDYSENFDTYTAGNNVLPVCWNAINTTTYSSYAINPRILNSNSSSTPNCLYFYSYYYPSSYTNYDPQPQYAILPEMNDLAGMRITLKAKGYNTSSTFKVGTMSNPTDASTFTLIAEQTGLTTSYEEYTFDIPTTTTDRYVAIMIEAANSTVSTNSVYIDDISINTPPNCEKPTGLQVTASGLNATATWESEVGNYQIAYATITPTANPDDNIQGEATVETFTTEDLALGDYYFWVRANCGAGGYSEWQGPVSVHVGYCVPNPTSHDGSGITGVSFGTGDYVVANGDGSASLPASSPFYGDYTSMIGAVQAGVESTIAITTGTGSYPYTFVIWVDLDNSLSFEDSEILYIGKATSGNGTFNATITIPATQAEGDYRMRIYGADSYFNNFYNNGTTNWEAAHDPCNSGTWRHAHDYTLRVLEAPACLTPTALTLSRNGNQITAAWEGSASTYNIDINGTVTNNVANPYVFTAALSTTYTVKVQSNCVGEPSDWSTPSSITTPDCWNPRVIEYTLSDDYGDGWNGDAAILVKEGCDFVDTLTLSSGASASGTLELCGDYYEFIWKSGGNYDYECSFTFTEGGTTLFEGVGDEYSDYEVIDTIGNLTCPRPTVLDNEEPEARSVVLSWTENGTATNWQICVNNDEVNVINVTENPYTLENLDPETDYVVKVRAKCTSDDFSCWSDSVSFTTAPACPAPTGLTLVSKTTTTAAVSWTSPGITAWDVWYKADGDASYSSKHVEENPNTIITELTPGTTYTVYVVADCSNNNDGWSEKSDSITFTTPCEAITITENESYTQTFEAPVVTTVYSQVGQMPSCWGGYPTTYAGPKILAEGVQYNYSSSGQVLYFYGQGNNYAVFPVFTNALSELQVNFKWATESSSYGTLTLGYITDEDDNFSSFTAIETYPASSNSQHTLISAAPVYLNDYNLPANATQLVFRWNLSTQWGCNVDDVEVSLLPSYIVSAAANPTTGGNVTGVGTYPYGSTATLTAEANTGYTFTKWSDDVTSNPREVTVVSDSSFTAVFTLNSYEITAAANPTAGGNVTGAGTYNHGATATLTAEANTGYTFTNWTKNEVVVSTDPVHVFTIYGDSSYVANFDTNVYNVDIILVGPANENNFGSVDGPATMKHFLNADYTATPAFGYLFQKWTDNAGTELGTNEVLNIAAVSDTTVKAVFVYDTFAIAGVSADESMGTVSGSNPKAPYHSDVQLTATAKNGYHFVKWTNAEGDSLDNAVTITIHVEGDSTVIANFAANMYTITAESADQNMGSVAPTSTTAEYKTSVELTATPNYGYHFVKWTNAAGDSLDNATTISIHVEGDSTITANFAANMYTITAESADQTMGSVAPTSTTADYMTNVELTATANTGYHFVNWTNDDGDVLGTDATISIEVLRDSTLIANFAPNTYTITAQSADQNMGSVAPVTTQADYLTNVELTATPETGYHFVKWTNAAGDSLDNATTISVEVLRDSTLIANFAPNTYTITAQSADQNMGSVAPVTTQADYLTNVELTATPETGYHFVKWTNAAGDSLDNATTINIQVLSDSTLIANFAVNTYVVNVSINPAGSGDVYGTAGTATFVPGDPYAYGTQISLTADPEENKEFVNWTENGVSVSTDNPYEFELTAARSLTANFKNMDQVAIPDFNPAAGTIFLHHSQNQTVTLSCETEDAVIYYTTDGTTPTANSTAYTNGITVNNGTEVTIKAIAMKTGMQNSGISTATYKIVPLYDVTISDAISHGSASADHQTAAKDSVVTLTATPAEHYHFDSWHVTSGNDVITVTNNQFTMPAGNVVVSAIFELDTFQVNVTVNPDNTGSVTGTVGAATTSTTAFENGAYYAYNTHITLTATPATNKEFEKWTENGQLISTDATLAFDLDGARNLVANFKNMDQVETPDFSPAAGTIFLHYDENQTVTLSCNTEDATIYYTTDGTTPTANSTAYTNGITVNNGTEVTIKAIAMKTGMQNSGISTATYKIVPLYDVTISDAISHGSASADHQTAAKDSVVTLAATPAEHYHFDSWHVTSGNDVITVTNNQFTMPAGNVVVSAIFELDTFQVNVTVNPDNTGSVTGTVGAATTSTTAFENGAYYAYNTHITLTATPATNKEFVSWTEGGVEISTNATIAFDVTAERNLVANFKAMGQVADPTFQPDAGTYHVAQSVTINCATAGATIYYTMDNSEPTINSTPYTGAITTTSNGIDTIKAIAVKEGMVNSEVSVAVYEIIPQYTITVAANPTEGGTVSGGGTFNHGESATLEVVVEEGYTFNNWTLNGNVVSEDPSYTLTVTAAGDYVANFTLNTYDITVAANPTAGGIVSGGGTYNHGETVTLTATASTATGYTFTNWTKNGSVVSEEATYTFTITEVEAGAYVANFTLNTQTLTIHYQYEDGTAVGDDTVKQVNIGSTYNVVSPEIDCYVADKLNVTGTMGVEEVKDTVTYTSLATTGIDERVVCDSLKWMDGVTYYESTNEPTYTLTNAAGCDSVVTLHLTIHTSPAEPTLLATNNSSCENPNGSIEVTAPLGTGITYSMNGGAFQSETTFEGLSTGTFTITAKNAAGCTSKATAPITTTTSDLSVEVSANPTCEGGDLELTATPSTSGVTYSWTGPNNFTSTEQNPVITGAGADNAGTYTVVVTETATSCTATSSAEVTVSAPSTSDEYLTECDSVEWNGTTYYQSTEETVTLSDVAGCDSVVTLHLTINYSTTGDTTATACESFVWYGETLTQSGEYTHTFAGGNAAGCDSVVTLNLTINQSTTGDTAATACESFVWYGETLTQSGEYTHTFVGGNAAGCDSVVTLNLTINQNTTGDDYATICESELPYTWQGETFTDAGDKDITLASVVTGCDSVVTLHLTVNETTYGIDEQFACDSLTWINGITYYQSTNEPTDTIFGGNVAGCDSVITLHLTIYHAVSTELKDTICASTNYNNYGFNISMADIAQGENVFTDTLETSHGCDSVVILKLFMQPCIVPCGEPIHDIDNNIYQTKQFGHLCWMLSNLRTTRYTNGNVIPFAIVYTSSQSHNNPVDVETFGRLYNWASASYAPTRTASKSVTKAVAAPQYGICPYGWRLPTQAEFEQLNVLYSEKQLRSADNWAANAGNNESGFNKQPAGFYNPATGGCEGLGTSSHFYTSDFQPAGLIYQLTEYYCVDPFYKVSNNPQEGRSIRCVRDILDD